MIEGLQLGTIEGYENPADFFTGVDSRFGVFSIPFLFKDTAQANKVLADPEYNDFVMNMADAKGLVGVNLAVAAESLYFGAKKPLRTLDDFKGMKLRVNATPAERARMAALGATAVPMGLPEMITSLQNGVIDGTMSGMSIYTNFNLQNVGKIAARNPRHAPGLLWRDEQAVARQAAARPAARSSSTKRASCSHGRGRPRSMKSPNCARSGSIAAARSCTLSPAEQAELEKRLKPIGAEVTKRRSDAQGVLRQDRGARGEVPISSRCTPAEASPQ